MPSLATRTLLCSALAAPALLAGCGAGASIADEDGRQVVASFYPLAWVTEQVAGDGWTVTNLTSPGGEPHDLELSIGATASLADAALVVYLEHLQPAVDDAVATNVEGATLEAGAAVNLRPANDHGAEGHEEEGHQEEGHQEEGHEHGELDPHFWQDPIRMSALARAVAEELAALDPEHAERYRAAAERMSTELAALDRAYAEGLADCERDLVVVSHDAFGYLEKYGLHLEPIAGLSPDAEPTPAALAELAELIREEGLTTVFSERLASPAMAETLASDLGISTAVLDPVEGLTDETADEDYVTLMRSNLAALREANGC